MINAVFQRRVSEPKKFLFICQSLDFVYLPGLGSFFLTGKFIIIIVGGGPLLLLLLPGPNHDDDLRFKEEEEKNPFCFSPRQ